jgi:chemotaxis protein histidine kinase CheA
MSGDSDAALFALFRAEVETHLLALSDGLLALEKDPHQRERFQELMRAAHSIKGAAKIVGLDFAVQIAHEIEDCFVAARQDQLTITADLVDVLLQAVDLLGRTTEIDEAGGLVRQVADDQVARIVARVQQSMRPSPAGLERPPARTDVSQPAARLERAPVHLSRMWATQQQSAWMHAPKENRAIRLDCREVERIDAAALGLLALAARAARDTRSPTLQLINVPDPLHDLLDAMDLLGCCQAAAKD